MSDASHPRLLLRAQCARRIEAACPESRKHCREKSNDRDAATNFAPRSIVFEGRLIQLGIRAYF